MYLGSKHSILGWLYPQNNMPRQRYILVHGFLCDSIMLLDAINLYSVQKISISTMKVIVIGAGVAGLYAANLLKAEGLEVTVLEARSQAGGRVQTDYDFADFPIEKGAAYSHGDNHILYDLAEYREADPQPSRGKGYYYWQGKFMSRKEARAIEELREAMSVFPDIYQYKGPDLPLEEILQEPDPNGPVRLVLDGHASEYGCTFRDIGAASLAEEERLWPSTGGDSYFPKGMQAVFEEFVQDLGEDLLFNHAVNSIDYKNEKVIVSCGEKGTFEADWAIITVPLSVLKSRIINFSPALPTSKTQAIESLGIGAGMKVFLQFNQRIWPEDMLFVCGGLLCPWYEVVLNAPDEAPVLKAYLMGDYARNIAERGDQAIGVLLEELNAIFEEGKAAESFVQGKIVDWAKEPYIWGAYSYATPNSLGQREELQQPIDGKLYFAGEATHYKGSPATVHGAMETATWAAEAIINHTNSNSTDEIQ